MYSTLEQTIMVKLCCIAKWNSSSPKLGVLYKFKYPFSFGYCGLLHSGGCVIQNTEFWVVALYKTPSFWLPRVELV